METTSNLSSLAAKLLARLPNQTFPRFAGKPTFTQVRTIEKLVEQNAGSIKSTVQGAGGFNHIFLTKTPAAWTALTGLAPVAIPVSPDEPIFLNNATAARIAQLNQQYERQKRHYDTTEAMKEVLINQIISAFDANYITALRHEITRQVTHQTIPEVFRVLYEHGRVQYQTVRETEAEILATPINLDEPLAMMFDTVEDLQALALAADEPKTPKQILNLTLTLIKQTGNSFLPSIIVWNDRPEAEKTWVNLKLHFNAAHRKLQNASDLPIGQSALQQEANNLAHEVTERVNREVQEQLNVMQQSIEQALQLSTGSSTSSNNDMITSSSSATSNNVETPTTQLKSFFKEQLNNLQAEHRREMNDLKNTMQQKSNNNNKRRGGNNKGGRSSKRQRDTSDDNASSGGKKHFEGRLSRRKIDQYCWTHGACNHSSKECNYQDDNHKKEATFDNKMGGSFAFCQYVGKDK